MENRKVTIADIQKMKRQASKVTMVTAYDYPTAKIADEAGIDIVLVGDSYGMVVLGYDSTLPVTVEEMLPVCRAVSRAAKRPLIVADMPFMSFQVSVESAVRNAGRFIKEGGCDVVKLEGGKERMETARAIVKAGIPVLGHVALTPQSAIMLGGYRLQGKTASQAKKIIDDAIAMEEAGAFALVLEMLTAETAQIITETIAIPTIGIGAGPHCDGQVLVLHDILGLYPKFTPKFAKQYAQLAPQVLNALQAYSQDVRSGRFPAEEHTFHMEQDEAEELRALLGVKRTVPEREVRGS